MRRGQEIWNFSLGEEKEHLALGIPACCHPEVPPHSEHSVSL